MYLILIINTIKELISLLSNFDYYISIVIKGGCVMYQAWLSRDYQDKVLCEACYQRCILDESEVGVCGVRQVVDGELKLLVYEKAAALNIDPIEKKPLYHFMPRSQILSLGTVGCNFSCQFCQNSHISQYPKEHNNEVFGEEAKAKDIVEIAKKRGMDSIAYTYNEPVIFFEYAYEIAKLANENGLKNIFVTSGYETHKAIDTIAPYLDAMNIDLKSFDKNFYQEICGAKLKPVLDTIEYTYKQGIWIEITTLVIPSHNDSDEELRLIAKYIASISPTIPWHISGFFPNYNMKNTEPTPIATLLRAYDIGKEEGLEYVYIGNVHDYTHQSTFCPRCGELLIKRDQYDVQIKAFKGGCCSKCNHQIEGVF